MIISINQHTLEPRKFNGFEEMYNFLENCNAMIMIEKKSESENEKTFYALNINLNQSVFIAPSESNKKTLGVGISLYENVPTILSIPDTNLVFLGLDDEVIGISLQEKSVAFRISLMNLPFHGFFQVLKEKIILIFYELGVVAVDFYGKEIWGYDRDVLCESMIDKNKLILEFLDIGTIVLDVNDGRVLGHNRNFS